MYPPEHRDGRPWQVLLIGGASGAGKTSVSYRLAEYFKVGITEIDDIHVALERMTTPEQQPEIHFWRTHPDADGLSAEENVKHLIALCRAMAPAVEAVIANHLQTKTPVVLDGDYILPEVAVQTSFCGHQSDSQVRMVIIDEADEEQLLRNFRAREAEDQVMRAKTSWLHGRWLKQEAEACGGVVVSSRPWDTLLQRVVQALAL